MNETDLISVIIPVHNAEKFISKTISRLLKQSYKNIEIIIILNNCTDCSKEICVQFSKKDDRIKIFEDNVVGLLLVRKRGILESHGKYICWMDADDYYVNDYAIERMHNAVVEDNAQICQFSHYLQYRGIYRKKIDVTSKNIILNKNELFDGPLMGIVPGRGRLFGGSLWSKIYDGDLLRYAIQTINLPIFYQEDCFMNFLFFTDDKIVNVSARNEAYYVYYRYGSSMTNSCDAAYKILKDYSLFKPIEINRLNELPVNPEIILRVHSESLWAYRASINSLLKDGVSDDEILSLISDAEKYEYICMTKEYFRTHPENIWTEEMNFMISDYTPQEYLDWCKLHLPKITYKEKIKSIIKKVLTI